jgi:hypothetical protein
MAKFNFRGTGIVVYGAKRDNHGIYSGSWSGIPDQGWYAAYHSVKLDEGDEQYYSGQASPGVFGNSIYSVSDLDPAKDHTIVRRRLLSLPPRHLLISDSKSRIDRT